MYIVEIKNGNITTQIHGLKRKLKSGNVVKGINSIDSFSFAILPSNAGFNLINDLQTLATVYNTNKKRYEFYGRVLYSASTMEESGLIYKDVICESYLGFLCDSQQKYVEEQNWTVKGLLEYIIGVHNSQVEDYKQFAIGEVTVTDPNDNLYLGIQRTDSWTAINEKLIDKLGGEIRFRVEEDAIYLDYLERIGSTLSTAIKMSKNMKSITREGNSLNYISRLIPLGAKLTTTGDNGNEVESEKRLDITSVNDGLDYIESTAAVEKYGIRYGYAYFDNVTTASVLLSKGKEYLAENNKVQVKYSITALDLSLLGLDINDFDVYNYHPIENPLLGIDDTARIIKKNTDIVEEYKSTFEIGDNFKTLSDLLLERDSTIKDAIEKIESTKNELKEYVNESSANLNEELKQVVVENNTTLINDCESIILNALSSYTETGDFETFKETVSAQLQLLSDEMTVKFSETTEKIVDVNGDLQSQIDTITKYFTFDINGLTIGQENNPNKVIIDNDDISILVNDVVVQQFKADGTALIPELQITRALKLFDTLLEYSDGIVGASYAGGEE